MRKTEQQLEIEFKEFLKEINTSIYSKENITAAYELAKKAHIGQIRKNGNPYIQHPIEVAKIVHSLGLDEASIIASILHDVAEDTDITLKQISEQFGKEVELIVDGLTKIDFIGDIKENRENKKDRDVNTLRKILLASAKDIRILIVKLCDRLHNMRTLIYMVPEKRKQIAQDTLLIYVPIAQKIGLYTIKWELEDLAFKYRNTEMFKYIKNKINMKRSQREEIVEKAVIELKDFLKLNGFKEKDVIILGRPKNFYSIFKKIKDDAKSFEDLYDLYAIRVIVKNIGECYTILGLLHEAFQSFPNKLKDYISNPKANGYQSIHTVVYSRAIKSPVEIQIRTEEMHKLAEFGIAAHWKYKNIKEDKKFEKKIAWLREVMQWEKEHKDNSEFLKLLKFDFFEDEIFVFTPKNDVITLPDNSSVIDMAYAIHTDIGDKAYKAKVNGLITTLDKTLKSGDIVEIITHKSAKPSEKWLNLVKTAKARTKIRDSLNLKHSGKQSKEKEETSFETLKDKILRLDEYKKIRKAKCCHIEYKDQLVGVFKNKEELVIHNASCDNAKYTVHKKILLPWKEDKQKIVTMILILKDRFGLLIDVLNIFSEYNLNLNKVNSKVNRDGSVKMEIKIEDGPYMNELMEKLNKLEAVENVKIIKGLFF